MSAEGPPSVFSTASRTKKWIASCVIYYGTFSLGLSQTYLNPTMLDYGRKFGVDADDLAIVFTILTAFYLVGALLGGILLNFMNRQLFIIGCFVLMTIPLFAYPYAESKTILCVFAALAGIGGGGFDCAQVAWVIDIWRHEAAPFILTEHFGYAFGTLIPPLVLEPFLADEEPKGVTGGTTLSTISSSSSAPYESRLATPFFIGGAMLTIGLISQIALYVMFRNAKIEGKESTELSNVGDDTQKKGSTVSETKPEVIQQDSLKRRIYLVVLCCFLIAFYQALELCTGQFLPMFANYSPVHFEDKAGARLSLCMQIGFAAGRFVGIFIVLKIAPYFILAACFILLLVSNTLMLAVGVSNALWLWISSAAFGVGMSCVYPALFAFVEKYLFVTDTIAATIAVCGGLVSAAYPLIIGDSVKEHPGILSYVNFVSIAVCSVSLVLLFWTTHLRAKRMERKKQLQ